MGIHLLRQKYTGREVNVPGVSGRMLLTPENEAYIAKLRSQRPTSARTLGSFNGTQTQTPEQYDQYVLREIQRMDAANRDRRGFNRIREGMAWSTLGVLGGAGAAAALGAGGAGAAAGGSAAASVPGAVGASAAPLGGGTVIGGAGLGSGVAAGLPAAGTAATGAGLTSSGLLASSPIVGTLAPYAPVLPSAGLAPAVWSGAISGGGSSLAPAAGRFFTGRDMMQYGIPAASQLAGTIIGTRANSAAAQQALDEQRRQYDLTQAFLQQQHLDKMKADADVEAEKKRQFDALEAEKRRRYEALEPWRSASLQNVTRMSDLLNEPRPRGVPYTGNFSSPRY